MECEIWKPILHQEAYSISNLGSVRNENTGLVLKPYVGDRSGHLRVDLPNGRYYVHVLVAKHFLPTPRHGMEVCHRNNKPDDNRASNLRWDTRSSNVLDLRIDNRYCKNGHLWAENAYYDKNGWRSCRLCRRASRMRHRMGRSEHGSD